MHNSINHWDEKERDRCIKISRKRSEHFRSNLQFLSRSKSIDGIIHCGRIHFEKRKEKKNESFVFRIEILSLARWKKWQIMGDNGRTMGRRRVFGHLWNIEQKVWSIKPRCKLPRPLLKVRATLSFSHSRSWDNWHTIAMFRMRLCVTKITSQKKESSSYFCRQWWLIIRGGGGEIVIEK